MGIGNAFKGFDSIYSTLRMFIGMGIKLLLALIAVQIFILAAIIYLNHNTLYGKIDKTDICIYKTYLQAKAAEKMNFVKRQIDITYPCGQSPEIVSFELFMNKMEPYIERRIYRIKTQTLGLIYWTSLLYLILPLIMVLLSKKFKSDSKDKFIRGSKIISPEKLKEMIAAKCNNEFKFRISDNVHIPLSIINRHCICLGRPGTGKTQLISRIVKQIIANGYRAVIHDFKGDFISTFYDYKKHLIFNPLDKRHMGLKDVEMQLIDDCKELKMVDCNDKIGQHYNDKISKQEDLYQYYCIKHKQRTAKISDNEEETANNLIAKYCDEIEAIDKWIKSDFKASNFSKRPKNEYVLSMFSYSELLDEIRNIVDCIEPNSKFIKIKTGLAKKESKTKGWSIFNELKSSIDVDAFCASLIPESASQDNFWPISSRQLLGSIITYCIYNNKTTYQELWKHVNLGNAQLLELFKSTPGCEEGCKLLTEDKTANSILAVMSNYTKPIKYLVGTEGNFSIKKWVAKEDHEKKIIFLSNQATVQETLRPFLTLFADFSIKTLLSLEDNLSRRLFFILDEFGELGKIGTIVPLLTGSRSKGGAGFILIQDTARLNTIYGQDGRTTIVNACGNLISFAVKKEEADFVSECFGTVEIKRTDESKSVGVDTVNNSISISKQTVEKQLVLPSEITNIPTLNFYIQLTDYDVSRDKLDIESFPKSSKDYIEREDLFFKPKPQQDSTAPLPLAETIQPPVPEPQPEVLAQSQPTAQNNEPSINDVEQTVQKIIEEKKDFDRELEKYGNIHKNESPLSDPSLESQEEKKSEENDLDQHF